jgi:hypothetical protein
MRATPRYIVRIDATTRYSLDYMLKRLINEDRAARNIESYHNDGSKLLFIDYGTTENLVLGKPKITFHEF